MEIYLNEFIKWILYYFSGDIKGDNENERVECLPGMYIYLSIYLIINLSIYLSNYLSIYIVIYKQ